MFSPNPERLPSKLVIKWITWIKNVVTWFYLNATNKSFQSNEKTSIIAYFFAQAFLPVLFLETMVWLESTFNCQLPVNNKKILYLTTLTPSFISFNYSEELEFLNAWA